MTSHFGTTHRYVAIRALGKASKDALRDATDNLLEQAEDLLRAAVELARNLPENKARQVLAVSLSDWRLLFCDRSVIDKYLALVGFSLGERQCRDTGLAIVHNANARVAAIQRKDSDMGIFDIENADGSVALGTIVGARTELTPMREFFQKRMNGHHGSLCLDGIATPFGDGLPWSEEAA